MPVSGLCWHNGHEAKGRATAIPCGLVGEQICRGNVVVEHEPGEKLAFWFGLTSDFLAAPNLGWDPLDH